jgi:hypothetical protein
MSRERQFAKNLDNMLAGRVIHAEQPEEAEMLAFAARLNKLKRPPSLEFKSRLKAKLLQKLDEHRDKRTSRGWLWQLLAQPLTRAALVFMGILITGSLMWAAGVFNPTGVSPQPTVIKAAAVTDKNSYQPGEPVLITVSLLNMTADVLTMVEYPPILSLMRADNNQAAYTFRAGSGTRVIEPEQTATFTLSWDQRSDSGQQVAPGRYYVELEDLYYQSSAVKLTFEKKVEFKIG